MPYFEKSWRFRKKTMGLKCLIYRSALKLGRNELKN